MKYVPLLLQLIALQACASATTCGDSGSQLQMTSCAQRDLARLEGELQKKHEALSEALEDSSLDRAISAWKDYRDVHCTSTSSIHSGGSLYEYVFTECKAELTRRRISSLGEDYQDTLDIIKQGSP